MSGSICKSCEHLKICGRKIIDSERTVMTGCSRFEERKPQTHADRLRAMSDEELAEWVWGAETSGRAYGPRGKKAWLNWLKSPVEENE